MGSLSVSSWRARLTPEECSASSGRIVQQIASLNPDKPATVRTVVTRHLFFARGESHIPSHVGRAGSVSESGSSGCCRSGLFRRRARRRFRRRGEPEEKRAGTEGSEPLTERAQWPVHHGQGVLQTWLLLLYSHTLLYRANCHSQVELEPCAGAWIHRRNYQRHRRLRQPRVGDGACSGSADNTAKERSTAQSGLHRQSTLLSGSPLPQRGLVQLRNVRCATRARGQRSKQHYRPSSVWRCEDLRTRGIVTPVA